VYVCVRMCVNVHVLCENMHELSMGVCACFHVFVGVFVCIWVRVYVQMCDCMRACVCAG